MSTNHGIEISQDGKIAYVVNQNEFRVIDITDPSNLRLLAHINNSNSGQTIGGHRLAISSDERYAFTSFGQIIVISNIQAWDGNTPPPDDKNTLAYVNETVIPNSAGGWPHRSTSHIELRTVGGKDYAYYADYHSGLVIFDVTDVNNPIFLGAHTRLQGLINQATISIDISRDGSTAYVINSGPHWGALSILDISDLSSTTYNPQGVGHNVGVKTHFTSTSLTEQVIFREWTEAITLSSNEDIAFVGSNGGIKIIDLSDTNNQSFYNTTGGAVRQITLSPDGNTAYVSADFGGADILDISDPFNPQLIQNVKNLNKYSKGNAISPDQSTLLLAHHGGALEAFDAGKSSLLSDNSDTVSITVNNINDSPTGSVAIIGTSEQGEVLTASNSLADVDGLGSISYQWNRDGSAISGATASTYTLMQADVGSVITVTANYTDGQGTAESVTSLATSVVANVNDAATGAVTISGTPTQGEVLTASNSLADVDGLGPISYQWNRDRTAISGATSSTYTLLQADVDSTITVTATFTDGFGTAESVTSSATSGVANVNDSPTGQLSISGIPVFSNTLTADTSSIADPDGLGGFTYQWKAEGINIVGATNASYQLSSENVENFESITVAASYTDQGGTSESLTSNSIIAGHVDLDSNGILDGSNWKSYRIYDLAKDNPYIRDKKNRKYSILGQKWRSSSPVQAVVNPSRYHVRMLDYLAK